MTSSFVRTALLMDLVNSIGQAASPRVKGNEGSRAVKVTGPEARSAKTKALRWRSDSHCMPRERGRAQQTPQTKGVVQADYSPNETVGAARPVGR